MQLIRSVTGNMTKDLVALKTVETAHTGVEDTG
jgi:hypothetical protein